MTCRLLRDAMHGPLRSAANPQTPQRRRFPTSRQAGWSLVIERRMRLAFAFHQPSQPARVSAAPGNSNPASLLSAPAAPFRTGAKVREERCKHTNSARLLLWRRGAAPRLRRLRRRSSGRPTGGCFVPLHVRMDTGRPRRIQKAPERYDGMSYSEVGTLVALARLWQ